MFVTRITGVLVASYMAIVACSVMAAPLNHYQLIGSHNSYKQGLFPVVERWLEQHHANYATQFRYSQISLNEQLQAGLRQLEIDVVADPKGGHHANPWAEQYFATRLLKDEQRAALRQPGFKVLHIPGIDFSSECIAFSDCLARLKRWSEQHPGHFPLMIMLNAKETQPDFVKQPLPVAFDKAQYEALDSLIVQQLGREKLFVPDDLRGSHDSLRNALLQQGWPDLNELKGKFIFVFDANSEQAELYRNEHKNLRGRSMFSSYAATEDEAAIIIANDPIEQQRQIQQWVKQGFLVRTRADADFNSSNAQREARFDAAQSSGAHWISTDFYPGSPEFSRYQYEVKFDDKHLVRPNPLFSAN